MNANEIAIAIRAGQFSMDELHVIREAYNIAVRVAQQSIKRTFKLGDRVDTRGYGHGTIDGIGPKNIMVKLDRGGRLRSSPSLLTAL